MHTKRKTRKRDKSESTSAAVSPPLPNLNTQQRSSLYFLPSTITLTTNDGIQIVEISIHIQKKRRQLFLLKYAHKLREKNMFIYE